MWEGTGVWDGARTYSRKCLGGAGDSLTGVWDGSGALDGARECEGTAQQGSCTTSCPVKAWVGKRYKLFT